MRLDDEIVRGFELGKVHKLAAPLNSISFHRTEDLLAAATDDDDLHIVSLSSGDFARRPVRCGKYGARCVAWTHSGADVLHASAKGGPHSSADAVRYLALGAVQYRQYFEGHTARVTAVEMSPRSDAFITAAEDNTVRLWDLRTPVCQAVLRTPGPPTAAFDQQGLVFAVGVDGGVVKLFDASQYGRGPFGAFVIPELSNTPVPVRQLVFSNDGAKLVAAAGGSAYVLDAFSGDVKATIRLGGTDGPPVQQPAALKEQGPGAQQQQQQQGRLSAGAGAMVSLSYDGEYLMAACDGAGGAVGVWSASTGARVAEWKATAADAAPRVAAWAPRRLAAATGTMALSLWVPGPAAIERGSQQQQQRQQQQQQQQPAG